MADHSDLGFKPLTIDPQISRQALDAHADLGFQPDQPKEKTVGGFVSNVGTSAGNFVGDLAHAVTHPIDTAAGVGKLITGGMQRGLEAVGFPKPPEEQQTGKSTAPEFDGLIQNLTGRYGSLDKVKETMYRDPVGFISDLSMVAGGAGVVSDAAKLARLTQALGAVSEFSDPVRLTGKLASTLPLNAAGDAIKRSLAKGALRGGYQTNTDAQHLGAKVTEAADSLVGNGIQFSEKGVQDLQQTLGALQKNKEQLALSATQGGGASVHPNTVTQALQDLRQKWESQAFPPDDLKQIDRVIEDWKTRHPYPIGLDEAEAIKEGTYRNNKYSDAAPPPHLAATAAAEKTIAHTLMTDLEQKIPELKDINPAEGNLLQLKPMLMTALTKYRNSGGFWPNLYQNATTVRGGVIDAMASGLGFGVSHDPATAALAGGSAALTHALLSDPMVRTQLAIMINRAQAANPGKYGAKAASMATATARIDDYLKQLGQ